MDRESWGSFALAQSWIGAVRKLRAGLSGERLLWLLICSGRRTYRFLPVFFREFYPRVGHPTPPHLRLLINGLAEQRYGDTYDLDRGVVRLRRPQPLRAELRDPPGTPTNAHARFFTERNPDHAAGDELACLTELKDDNLTRAGWRMALAEEPLEAAR